LSAAFPEVKARLTRPWYGHKTSNSSPYLFEKLGASIGTTRQYQLSPGDSPFLPVRQERGSPWSPGYQRQLVLRLSPWPNYGRLSPKCPS
ncbi:MAG: hypothetical protein ACK53L_18180, partial [Pirellulaceae bacterium]